MGRLQDVSGVAGRPVRGLREGCGWDWAGQLSVPQEQVHSSCLRKNVRNLQTLEVALLASKGRSRGVLRGECGGWH